MQAAACDNDGRKELIASVARVETRVHQETRNAASRDNGVACSTQERLHMSRYTRRQNKTLSMEKSHFCVLVSDSSQSRNAAISGLPASVSRPTRW